MAREPSPTWSIWSTVQVTWISLLRRQENWEMRDHWLGRTKKHLFFLLFSFCFQINSFPPKNNPRFRKDTFWTIFLKGKPWIFPSSPNGCFSTGHCCLAYHWRRHGRGRLYRRLCGANRDGASTGIAGACEALLVREQGTEEERNGAFQNLCFFFGMGGWGMSFCL